MIRKILAVVVGVISGGIVIGVTEAIGHSIYPLPAGLDPTKPELIAAYLRTAPLGALVSVIVGWALGAFTAGAVTTLIARSAGMMYALIAAGVLLLFGVINLLMIPHPVWFWIAGVLVFLPAGWLGYRLVRAKTAS